MCFDWRLKLWNLTMEGWWQFWGKRRFYPVKIKKKTYPIRDPRKWIIKMPMKGVVLLGIWNCCVLMLFDIDTMLQPGNVNLVFS